MTHIVLIIFSSIFVLLMSVCLFTSDSDEKDTKRKAALLMVLIIIVCGVSLYDDIMASRTHYYDFIEEYVAAKAIIETEIQNKTIFSNNEQLIDRAINYNIKLLYCQRIYYAVR